MMKPAWLEGLMAEETFFAACGFHKRIWKNEKNIFCLNCCQSFCTHCLSSHPSHPFLQVRKYVYRDVIKLDDLQSLIDCSYIQPYTLNNAEVIFLHSRTRTRTRLCKGSDNVCFNCDRILKEPFHFCSLSCKVDHLVCKGEGLSNILHRLDESNLAPSKIESEGFQGVDVLNPAANDEKITGSYDVLEEPAAKFKASSSSSNALEDCGKSLDPMKKEGKSLPIRRRRKGTPRRSPLS
ncbi:protein RGF1 INDUCIBLE TRANSCRIPTION FACTOR 1-like [Diospyros lotus]|uniref:protein RGF1 INDUCIBLE TRANSCRIPTION FACTOR 1-like n=1 Tax=Diospyros lotus TaxID=55363 RepID=UPI002251B52D|nr:protein RGF1 INDUCIBLE TRANSCRIPTION FACTOR 1-like [Diospyros lotus]